VLKTAGIVVAASAVSVLAISPLAFAGDKDDRDRGGRHDRDTTQVNRIDNDRSNNQNGLINLGDVNALNDLNACPSVATSGIGNLLGILGSGESEASSDDVTCVNDDSTTQFNNND
jgi:hypothetical protein